MKNTMSKNNNLLITLLNKNNKNTIKKNEIYID